MIITTDLKIHLQKGISNQKSNRQGKLLGLFTIVTFPNYECNTESENLRGKNKCMLLFHIQRHGIMHLVKGYEPMYFYLFRYQHQGLYRS